jgi:cell wall-associated NlpC family hydrolase
MASYPDVPTSHWAYDAIQDVSVRHTWLPPYSTGFQPNRLITRFQLARALVLAYAPLDAPDPTITFTDLTSGSWFKVANVAVKHGWLVPVTGAFNGYGTVSKFALDRALILALDLGKIVVGLNNISTEGGYHFAHSYQFGYQILSAELHLNYNYPTSLERQELLPGSSVSRAFAAYALWKATTLSQWETWSLQSYASITLPIMNSAERKAVEFAFRWAGYPYVYAGEWYKRTGSGYCCGTQLQGGFDCSGFTWWVLKSANASWDPRPIRGYYGYSLPQRTSMDMARYAPAKIRFSWLQPMDIVLFDTAGTNLTNPSYADHAGMYLGNGWMIHSSGSRGGVSIDYIGAGSWWSSHFMWGRRLMPTYVPPPPPPPPPPPDPDPSPSPTVSPSPSPSV